MLRVGVLAQAPGGPLTSSAWIRLLLPLRRVEQLGACVLTQLQPGDTPVDLDRLIVQRAACPSLVIAEALVQACRAQALPLILDLEDAVAPEAKVEARGAIAAALARESAS